MSIRAKVTPQATSLILFLPSAFLSSPLLFILSPLVVEMRGVEPRSKHGINLLSTCLSSLWVFVCGLRLRLP